MLRFADGFPEELKGRVQHVYSFFSWDLVDDDVVFLWKKKITWCSACYDMKKHAITLTEDGMEEFAIAHELTHALQYRAKHLGIPHGERSCDLFAMARCDQYIDHLPYYVQVNQRFKHLPRWFMARLLYVVANLAIEQRKGGNRNYIVWFEAQMKALDQRQETEWTAVIMGNLRLVLNNHYLFKDGRET